MASSRRATAPRRAARAARPPAPRLARVLPSARSLAAGLALLGLATGAYVLARETSVFAVRELEVVGGSPQVQKEVRAALAPELGRSLVRIDGREIDRRVSGVAGVLSVRYDRAFPHTLKIVLVPETPVLLLRRGGEGWLVSARGRVVRAIDDVHSSPLPRVWVPKDTMIRVGAVLPAASGGIAANVLAPLRAAGLPVRVRAVRAADRELTLVLRSGLEVRLGDNGDLRLKLAVARRILLVLGNATTATYVDVSVPERPVVGGENPQAAGTA